MKSKNPENHKPKTVTAPNEAGIRNASASRRCSFCGQKAELIWVHGHGQCAACGINSHECCSGEQCNPGL